MKNCGLSALRLVLNSVKEVSWFVGMISGDGVGSLVRLQGMVNAGVYKQLVKDHVLPVLRNSTKQPSIFMQDKAPCHTAMAVMNFLKAKNVTLMD